MNIESLEKNYINNIGNNLPEWACKKISDNSQLILPSMPFIGENYHKAETKVLVYASAENLNYYKKKEKHLDNNEVSINRHRYCFDNYSKYNFYPNLHIEPFNNGALMCFVGYLLYKKYGKKFDSPYSLAEEIAIANFGKFTIETNSSNKDYAHEYNKLKDSLPYIEDDLKFLTPEIIILPKEIYYKHKKIKELIANILPEAKILPIRQITPTTINTQINKKFEKKKEEELPEWIRK
jgi:hypothetical protein